MALQPSGSLWRWSSLPPPYASEWKALPPSLLRKLKSLVTGEAALHAASLSVCSLATLCSPSRVGWGCCPRARVLALLAMLRVRWPAYTHTHTHTTTSRLTHLQLVHEFRALWSCLPASLCPRHGGLRKWDCPSLMHTISSQREGKHLAHGLALVGRNELHQGDWEKIGTCC